MKHQKLVKDLAFYVIMISCLGILALLAWKDLSTSTQRYQQCSLVQEQMICVQRHGTPPTK